MQRSVRENIALPFSARGSAWGPLDKRREKTRVDDAISRLQIDTRAQREVQRLSGGNQQKVTIARWIAAGAKTILCFDPTRGIDPQARNLQAASRARFAGLVLLLYTSELEAVHLVATALSSFSTVRVVDVLPARSPRAL